MAFSYWPDVRRQSIFMFFFEIEYHAMTVNMSAYCQDFKCLIETPSALPNQDNGIRGLFSRGLQV